MIALLLALAAPSVPEITVAQWRAKPPKERLVDDTFLAGAMNAYFGMNSLLQQNGQKTVFCPPPSSGMSGRVSLPVFSLISRLS